VLQERGTVQFAAKSLYDAVTVVLPILLNQLKFTKDDQKLQALRPHLFCKMTKKQSNKTRILTENILPQVSKAELRKPTDCLIKNSP
jgi:dihydroorotase